MLWLYQRVFFLEVNPKVAKLSDMVSGNHYLVPLIILVLWIGYIRTYSSLLCMLCRHLLERVSTAGVQEAAAAKAIMEVIR